MQMHKKSSMCGFTGSRRTGSRRGSMMVLVMVSLVLLSGIMMASLEMMSTTRNVIDYELNYHGEAVNTAKAGLIDALSWFRRQTAQPVEEFDPQRDIEVIPPINDTDDNTLDGDGHKIIGIIREYELSRENSAGQDQVWGRYEIRRRAVRDITDERNLSGNGRFWYIESKGYIFRKRDPDTYTPDKFYQLYEFMDDGSVAKQWRKLEDESYVIEDIEPDGKAVMEKCDLTVVDVLASAKMATELRRISVIPPGNAAFCAAQGSNVYLRDRSRVLGGGGYGLLYPSGTGTHYKHWNAELNGSPAWGRADPGTYLIGMEDVFGVTKEELKTLADIYTEDPSNLPYELPEYSLVYIDSDVTFDNDRPLRGTAIVYVDGNVTLASNSSSYFSGILYVEDDYRQYAPSLVNGTVMVNGVLDISGLGDYSEVNFDSTVRQRILTISGQYRFSAPMYFLQ